VLHAASLLAGALYEAGETSACTASNDIMNWKNVEGGDPEVLSGTLTVTAFRWRHCPVDSDVPYCQHTDKTDGALAK
jgi:hypothetical protein